jgi:hypothetical protein
LPEADAALSPWRALHDWTAAHGLLTHVTVRIPVPVPLEPEIVDGLQELLPVEVTLARLENRPGALVAVVEPDEALRGLTAAVDALVPGLPPHRDARPDLAYHATVVRTADPAIRAAASSELAQRLPLTEVAEELCLFEWSAGMLRMLWRRAPRLVH